MWTFLVVTDDDALYRPIQQTLAGEHAMERALSPAAGLEAARTHRYDVLMLDLALISPMIPHDGDIRSVMAPFYQYKPPLEIVVIANRNLLRHAVSAVKGGASDYLTAPIDADEVKLVIEGLQKSALLQSELDYLRGQVLKPHVLDMVRTGAPAMKKVLEKAQSVAPTKTTVLITGETGTGKGVLARYIHRNSKREKHQFISLHCGAIPDSLLESELFGHEKGAFTGAVRKKLGKFEIARNGSIFLDEIGTITPSAQTKLLQVLQDGTFSRVGGEMMLETNARVITATNSDLKRMSDAGEFRKDLFYRLNVFPIEIPALRDRTEDIPFFLDNFLEKLNREIQKEIRNIDPRVIEAMKRYEWPGNIRELENLLERAYILENTDTLTPESFPAELFDYTADCRPASGDDRQPLAEARRIAVEDFERQYLRTLMTRNRGRINLSAQEAGISTRQLHKLLLKYGIHKEEFKPSG